MMAVCTVRAEPSYRRDAFVRGLQAVGYTVADKGLPSRPEDLLLLWNRKRHEEPRAAQWEALGGTVIVCENGYIGSDELGRQLYAISVGQHNGAGRFPVGSEDRWTPLGVELKPWRERTETSHVLVCAQRGIGSALMASPANWHLEAHKALIARTRREVRVRPHPGNAVAVTSLEADLRGAHACAIWSSSSGVKALTLGIPVLRAAPHWICDEASVPLDAVETCECDDKLRLRALRKMAHGQWRVAEIERGDPFARILESLRGASC